MFAYENGAHFTVNHFTFRKASVAKRAVIVVGNGYFGFGKKQCRNRIVFYPFTKKMDKLVYIHYIIEQNSSSVKTLIHFYC